MTALVVAGCSAETLDPIIETDGGATFQDRAADAGPGNAPVQDDPAEDTPPAMNEPEAEPDIAPAPEERTRAWVGDRSVPVDHSAARAAIAVDVAGNTFAVWEQVGEEAGIGASRYVAGVGWEPAQSIETMDPNYFEGGAPQVAVDGAGNAIAVWHHEGQTGVHIWASRYVVGTGWRAAERIGNDVGIARSPSIAVNSRGDALVVWEQSADNRTNIIWANRYSVNLGWDNARRIQTNDRQSAAIPSAAIDDAGNGVAVWQQVRDGESDAWANRFDARSGWGRAELLEHNDLGGTRDLNVAMAPGGETLAYWVQSDGVVVRAWAAQYVDGQGWSRPQALSTNESALKSYSPSIAFDRSGSALAVWMQTDDSDTEFWWRRFVPGEGWQDAERFERLEGARVVYFALALDQNGNGWVAWRRDRVAENRRPYDQIWARPYDRENGWGESQLIELDGQDFSNSLGLVMTAAGDAVAMWDEWDGETSTLWMNRYE